MSAVSASARYSFEEVMEQLERPSDDIDEYGPVARSSDFGPPSLEPAYIPSNLVSQLYQKASQAYRAPAAPVAPPTITTQPAQLPRILMPSTKPESIARELRIRADHSVEQLLELRRAFARRNHPDRASPETRDAATLRMSTANMMIDNAIAERQAQR